MAILSSPSPIRHVPDSHEHNPISASRTPHCAKCDQRTLFANEATARCGRVELLKKHSSRTSSKRRDPVVDRLSVRMLPAMPRALDLHFRTEQGSCEYQCYPRSSPVDEYMP